MMPLAHLDELEELGELNRLFLDHLQARVERKRDCLGLAASAARMLAAAPAERLDAAASMPRALFRFELEEAAHARVRDASAAAAEPQSFALRLTLLHSAWNLCRSSGYKARLLFGLTPQQVRFLRVTPVSRLPAIADAERLVACAFARSVWLWARLLNETRPEIKRSLLLIVLQPQVAPDAHVRFARERAGA